MPSDGSSQRPYQEDDARLFIERAVASHPETVDADAALTYAINEQTENRDRLATLTDVRDGFNQRAKEANDEYLRGGLGDALSNERLKARENSKRAFSENAVEISSRSEGEFGLRARTEAARGKLGETQNRLRQAFGEMVALSPDVAGWTVEDFQKATIEHERLKSEVSLAEEGLAQLGGFSEKLSSVFVPGVEFTYSGVKSQFIKSCEGHTIDDETQLSALNGKLNAISDDYFDLSPRELVGRFTEVAELAQSYQRESLETARGNLTAFEDGIRNNGQTQADNGPDTNGQ